MTASHNQNPEHEPDGREEPEENLSDIFSRISAAAPIRMENNAPPAQAGLGRPILMRGGEYLYVSTIQGAPPPAGKQVTRPHPSRAKTEPQSPGPFTDREGMDPEGEGPEPEARITGSLFSGNPGIRSGAVILLIILVLAMLNIFYNFKVGPPGATGGGGPPGPDQGGPPAGVKGGNQGDMPYQSMPTGECVLAGAIKFSDGRQPEFFQDVSSGPAKEKLYKYPGMDITLFIAGQVVIQPAVVDQKGMMGTIINLPANGAEITQVDEVVAEMEGYKTVSFKNIPIKSGRLFIPQIVMVPEGDPGK